jgi:hypothetical protein
MIAVLLRKDHRRDAVIEDGGVLGVKLAAQLSGMRDITKTSKVVGVGREKKFKLDDRRWCGKMGAQNDTDG